MVRPYTFTSGREILLKVEATGGPVQVIGAEMYDSLSAGAIVGRVNRSGASVSDFITESTAGIRNTILQSYAPDLVLVHLLDSAAQLADLQTWLALVLTSTPSADVLLCNSPYITSSGYTASDTDAQNLLYTAAAAANERVFISDVNHHFKSADYLTEVGFDTGNLHLPDRDGAAWKSVSNDIATTLGVRGTPYQARPLIAGAAAGQSNVLQNILKGIATFRTILSPTSAITMAWQWFESTGRDGWRVKKRASNDSNAAHGLDLGVDITGKSALTFLMIDTRGGVRLGDINTGSTTSAFTELCRLHVTAPNNKNAIKISQFNGATKDALICDVNGVVNFVVNYQGQTHAAGGYAHGATGSGATWTTGSGTPEAAVTAPIGSIFSRTDGGTGTSFYVKESGTGNTGWVAK